MPREDLPTLDAREERLAATPVALLLVAIVLIVLAYPVGRWLRHSPSVWSSGSPPPALHFCARDYRDPHRLAERLPSDPTAVEPRIEAVDGQRLEFPAVQTTRFNGTDVCTTVLEIHDAYGWVAYGLVGGP